MTLSLGNGAKTGQDMDGFTAMNYPEEKQLDVFILYELSSSYCTISLRIKEQIQHFSQISGVYPPGETASFTWACVMSGDWLLDAKHLPESE